ncbi:hypothetical protein [Gemmatimonas aurantiaca]|uniref:hypothetical protein n=1 Tax=Gemmatimonas aurantiaca TaxID=173480 RepID=UPI00301DDD14
MPIVLTFDLDTTKIENTDYGRLQSMFERFGWQNLGGTAYRYPRLGTTDQPVEDWLNHVAPALMMFRAYCAKRDALKACTLDVQSSSGYDPEAAFGRNALKANSSEFKWYSPTSLQFGEKNLKDWLDNVEFPY